VLDQAGIVVSDVGSGFNAHAPKIAFDGTEFLVVWQQQPTATDPWDVLGRRVGTDGTLLDASPIAIATGDGDQLTPDVVYSGDGHNFLVVWEDASGTSSDIRGTW